MKSQKHNQTFNCNYFNKFTDRQVNYFILVMFILMFPKHIYSQSPCPEVYFQNPSISNTASRVASFNLIQSIQSPVPTDPDSEHYPDSFPNLQYAFNVDFKIIRNDDGVRTTGDIGENEVMNRIRDLNLAFNQFNVFFKYHGLDYIDDTNLVGDRSFGDLPNDFITPYSSTDAFTLFVLDGDIITTDLAGTTTNTPGLGYLLGTVSFFSTFGINSTRIVNHEVGHNFYLKHDFANYGDAVNCEHVIRDNSDINNYNAGTTGDWIHDTPATKIWDFSEYNLTSGFYDGADIDCNDNLSPTDLNRFYKYGSVRINNNMHWHSGNDLTTGYYFTPGQGKRMRWVLATDTIQNYGIYSAPQVGVETLYQPFVVDNIGGDVIVSVTDNGDGTAKVCRNLERKDRFQKGFDATYYSMDDSPITSSNPDELKEIIGMTGDYKVLISQVHPSHKEIVSVVCTRGVICADEAYVGGIIISTDILGSMNITVQELTKIQVTDPDLFNNLMEHYYHILKKRTASGAETQQVIYKN